MRTKFIVVTNCTARKRTGLSLVRFAPRGHTIRQIAENWRVALDAQHSRLPAERLYVGRSILEARSSSQNLDARLFVVSAGVGLVESDEPIPSYDISASGSSTKLAATLTQHGATKADWWHLLTSGKGLGWLLRQHPDAMVLMSLPSEYLEMVRGDLETITPDDLSRMRVFTSPAGQRKAEQLPDLPVLPYDERLESITGYAGTRSDFPQRALKHFISALGAHSLPFDRASLAVSAALSDIQRKTLPKRRRLDDWEIRELIRRSWDDAGGKSAKLLRHLRDKELVACEQGRFSQLRRQVEAEIRDSGTHGEPRS